MLLALLAMQVRTSMHPCLAMDRATAIESTFFLSSHVQIYWFGLIVQMLIKVLILREKLSDIRDYEEEEEEEGEEEGTKGDKKRLEGGGGRDRWGEEGRGAIRNGHMAPQKTEKMH